VTVVCGGCYFVVGLLLGESRRGEGGIDLQLTTLFIFCLGGQNYSFAHCPQFVDIFVSAFALNILS
jgi:hypothetical protein